MEIIKILNLEGLKKVVENLKSYCATKEYIDQMFAHKCIDGGELLTAISTGPIFNGGEL